MVFWEKKNVPCLLLLAVDDAFPAADKDRNVPKDELKQRERAKKQLAAINDKLQDGASDSEVEEAFAALGGTLTLVGTILVGIPATVTVGAALIAAGSACLAAVGILNNNAALKQCVNEAFVCVCKSATTVCKKLFGQSSNDKKRQIESDQVVERKKQKSQ